MCSPIPHRGAHILGFCCVDEQSSLFAGALCLGAARLEQHALTTHRLQLRKAFRERALEMPPRQSAPESEGVGHSRDAACGLGIQDFRGQDEW